MAAGSDGLGVSDGGGLGGGNGCSNGVPYERCGFGGALIAAKFGMGEEIGGIINEDEEEGGAKKEEGFTRLVLVTRMLLFGSEVTCRGIGVEEAERGRAGTWGVGAGADTAVGAKEGEGTTLEE